jgi:hypothetical protein
LVSSGACDLYVTSFFDFLIQFIWFTFQDQLTMDLKHDIFLNGVVEASQGSPFHVVDYTCVCNGEIGVGNDDGVI